MEIVASTSMMLPNFIYFVSAFCRRPRPGSPVGSMGAVLVRAQLARLRAQDDALILAHSSTGRK